jgi:hypothetical protein
MVKIKEEWDEKQLNSFCFSTLIILFDLTHKYEEARNIFRIGGLNFSPSDSQINNWRKTKKNSSIFKDECMKCFIRGLAKLKNINNINFSLFDNGNKVTFFYDSFSKLFNCPPLKEHSDVSLNDFEDLINALHKFNIKIGNQG